MSLISIYDMGTKLMDFLEICHNAGYAHNDIAMDTIVLGQDQLVDLKKAKKSSGSCFRGSSLHVLDFSYMTPFIDFKTGKPLK